MESGDELENDTGQEGVNRGPNVPNAESLGPGAKGAKCPTKMFKSSNPLDFCVSM